ncbi:MAG: hypothetical protein K6G28_05870 [Acholeplasmatales bacterium]|nr:hypothetical protein [Acholeplasmatales bacterium]
MKHNDILKMVVLAVLIALTIVLQAFATTFKVGTYSLPLSLIVIAVGAFLYGPLASLLLGTIWGIFIFAADRSCDVFMAYSVPGTVLAVIGRGALNGLFVGLIYVLLKLVFRFRGGDYVAMFISALLLPLFNKFFFVLCEYMIFSELFKNKNLWAGFFAANLGISCLSSFIIAPVICRIVIAGRYILHLDNENNSNESKEEVFEDISNDGVFKDLN